jgi:hypothetical protein
MNGKYVLHKYGYFFIIINTNFKREEVAGGLRRMHTEELLNLYISPNIIRVIKSRRMGWAGHVSCTGQTRNMYIILIRKPEGRDHLEDLGVDGKIILECILGNRVGRCGLDSSGSGQEPVAGSCKYSNEPLSYIKGREFLD